MIDYKSIEIAKAIPEADSMIETFRAIGYNLESAIADIIDNSISAGAKNIRIQRIWRGGHSVLTIEEKLILVALALGSKQLLSHNAAN